ncbi:type II secretion system protein [Pantoea sp. B65]|uniref:type II secretion system protein n=1 Tax=Pantoea sp. B65 TaxID=2813359 RepID=UPI0039B5B293
MPTGNPQAGFSYLLLLAWLSIMALLLLRSYDHRQAQWRQEREAQLLFAGEQIRQAIRLYRNNPAGNKCFPTRFQQLLSDTRSLPARHLLRQIYADPFTQQREWGMIYDEQQRWIGVYSQGSGRPLKQQGFADHNKSFNQASSYAEWQFKVEVDPGAPLPQLCAG